MSETIDIAQLQEWTGRTQTVEDIATAAKSAGLRATLDYDADPWDGMLFPVGHWLHFTPDAPQHELAADGHPHKGGFLPPVPLPRRMWAASDITFHRPVRVGESLREVQTIKDVAHKSGRSGQLVFLTVDHEVYASEELAVTDVQTIVYREATAGQQAPAQSAAERAALTPADTSEWDYAHVVRPDETQLFRYSALTFNAHRIHYDRDYCINEEGYPGLVVHGPLSATLMVDAFMRHNPGVALQQFSFQARSPIFDNTAVAYVGRRVEDGGFEVAALNPEGTVCLKGTIRI
ncbi:MaoC family dehydratase N-terminal domain-containing protein [Brevibacterium daeguense]|uniref:MaoC family dehydratase N-terminal domain-containing protein n=1 Tax=Brevibacterium daeguense TaxID=909936 RepID=A0ABP8EKT5_9MICO|nr:MaoC family dehydratase N-terminal domain-containing protein [Brevibacterium daeguense]